MKKKSEILAPKKVYLNSIKRFEDKINSPKKTIWIKALAQIEVDTAIRARVGEDFINFYNYLLRKDRGYLLSPPKHSGHITIANPKHVSFNLEDAKKYIGKKVVFEYNPYGLFGGYRSNFLNYWFLVRNNVVFNGIRRELGIESVQKYHVTISNSKSSL